MHARSAVAGGALGILLAAATCVACRGERRQEAPPPLKPATDARPPVELRSQVIAPPCVAKGATQPSPLEAVANLRLAATKAICPAASPADVCSCLERDIGVLGDAFDHGPAQCELLAEASQDARVAQLVAQIAEEGLVAGVAYVVVMRGPHGWAAHGVATATADIDLGETPQLTSDARVLAVTEADFGDGRIVWVQTLATENDPTAGETDVSVESVLTVCRVGDVVHCGRVQLASWDARQGSDGECRDVRGAARQASQVSATSLSLTPVGGATTSVPVVFDGG